MSTEGTEPTQGAEDTTAPPATITTTDQTSAGSTDLVLAAPSAVQALPPAEAESMVPVDPATRSRLDQTAETYVNALASLDTHSQEFAKKVDDPHDGRRRHPSVGRRLQPPARHARCAAMGTGPVRQERRTVGAVAARAAPHRRGPRPVQAGHLFRRRSCSALIPFGDKLRDYFAKYQSAPEATSTRSSNALYDGQDELRQDNAALEQEKVNLWETMAAAAPVRLHRRAARRGARGDDRGDRGDRPREGEGPARGRAVLRPPEAPGPADAAGRVVQGYLAIDLVRKNNLELIKGVDRATTTTVSALRTAVIVAQALANQKLVLDQITALNTTTSNLIESTSEMLRDQSGDSPPAGRQLDDQHRASCRRRSRTSTRRWTRSTPSRSRRSTA